MSRARSLWRLGELPSPVALLRATGRALLAWQRRANERHRLMTLDDRALSDAGLNRADAWAEGRKPFWRR